jgi:hypothetical protein
MIVSGVAVPVASISLLIEAGLFVAPEWRLPSNEANFPHSFI